MNHAFATSFAVLAVTSAGLAACSSDPGEPSTTSSGTSGAGGNPTTSATAGSTTGSTSDASATSTGVGGSSTAACTQTMFGDDRPVSLHVPKSYSCDKGAPLVIMLHGYTASSQTEELYLNITAESEKRGFLYAHPDGTKDAMGSPFWNATDACCNLYGSTIDDSAYLTKLIKDIQVAYHVDPKRVYLFGHSNGAFMSYRMACEHGDLIAGIASLAGAMYTDVAKCPAANAVSLLEIHGTADSVIAYNGGSIGANTYPGATTSVGDWVTIDKCSPTADTTAAPIDIETSLAGDETHITSYAGCTGGTAVSLWTIQGGSHIPSFAPTFIPKAMDFLYAHPKP
ncbi:MAG: PHB depolymerase family esterase [Byssovorax sp.]